MNSPHHKTQSTAMSILSCHIQVGLSTQYSPRALQLLWQLARIIPLILPGPATLRHDVVFGLIEGESAPIVLRSHSALQKSASMYTEL